MQSRKSSILKPPKVREPLQDLNQLLPNNDDDEMTITDAQRRKVSFASTNKVKEFEISSECVAVINAASCTYEKRYSLSTDLCQPAIAEQIDKENHQVTNVSRKSIQNTFQSNATRQSIVDENTYTVEDVELTETIGRIYDIPMKSSGDSSMELTHVITQTKFQYSMPSEETADVSYPLNLTKENFHQTGSFADAHIVEIEVLSKNENDADNSSMETTEVITNNIIRIEKQDVDFIAEITESTSPNIAKNENDDTSSMETTEVIYNSFGESIKSQSVFFETLQSNRENDDNTTHDEVEYAPVQHFESPNDIRKRKSIFDMSCRRSSETSDRTRYDAISMQMLSQETNKSSIQDNSILVITLEENKTKSNSDMKLLSQKDQTKYHNSNMELLSQEDNETECNNSNKKVLIQENQTKYHNSSMELLTQEDNKTKFNVKLFTQEDQTKCHNSTMELLSQEDNKIKYNNSNMKLLTQEDYTKYHNSSMELLTQEDNKTKYNNSDIQLLSREDNKIKYFNSSMQFSTQNENNALLAISNDLRMDSDNTSLKNDTADSTSGLLSRTTALVNANRKSEYYDGKIAETENVNPQNTTLQLVNEVDSNEMRDVNEAPHETTLRSSLGDDSSVGSNSPLTVGVNFSIFQKNKETRVEFSGTIDSNKKKKSISNVKVNIINNKTEKQRKHMKELRFSMPATTKVMDGSENKKPDFSATFTDFSVPQDDSVALLDEKAISEAYISKCSTECAQSTESTDMVALNSFDDNDDRLNSHLQKPGKKRVSMDAFYDNDENEVCPKRRSTDNDVNTSNHTPEVMPCPQATDYNSSSALVLKHSFTEIQQRKESFVHEEKSVLAINDMIVETCSRNTNLNISYEARQLVTVSGREEQSNEPGELRKEQIIKQTDSCLGRNSDANENVEEQTEETRSDNGCSQSFNDNNTRSQFTNQSSQDTDNSLHNPSIIVNIGDSFSHYKSMDIGTDNVSVHDIRQLAEEKDEIKAVIDSDDISKENFVAEWLQHKTGKVNTENRHFISSSDSSSQSTAKSVSRLAEKSNITNNSEVLRFAEKEDTKLMTLEFPKTRIDSVVRTDANQNNETDMHDQPNEVAEKFKNKGKEATLDAEISHAYTAHGVSPSIIRKETTVSGHDAEENMVTDFDETNDNNTNEIYNTESVKETVPSADKVSEKDTVQEEMTVETNHDVEELAISVTDFVSEPTNVYANRMETFSRESESNLNSIDENVDLLATEFNTNAVIPSEVTEDRIGNTVDIEPIPCSDEVKVPKLTHKTKLLVFPSEATEDDIANTVNIETIPCSDEVNVPKSTSKTKFSISPSEATVDVIVSTDNTETIPCSDEGEVLKSTSKTKLCRDPVFVISESTSKKRQKMSPEFEKNKMETQQPTNPSNNVFGTTGREQNENLVAKKFGRHHNRSRKYETTRKDVLEKIELLSKNGDQKWKMKAVTDDKWVFQFFYDQMELTVAFNDEESKNACSASCTFVRPAYIKYYEISKIAVEFVIRKNESKFKQMCRSVEDIPYLLKLIEPDIVYIEGFVADILRLCDSEIFKIKNGRAVFYVYSFKQLMSAKIQVNITRLEKLSIKDIQVEEIVGKTDLNLIRNTFSDAGRDCDFFSKFVKKLWVALDQ